MIFRYVIFGILVLAAMVSASGMEKQLARVRLGMKPKDVIELLGEPTAIMIAQPPLSGPGSAAPAGGMLPGPGMTPGGGAAPQSAKENTLVFLYKDQEIELGANTKVAFGQDDIEPGALPLWAYTVRVSRLNLDQQEFFYRINDTYSLGLTISGEGNEARVSDAIACSLKPLTFWPSDPKRGFSRSDPFFQDMFHFKYADKSSTFVREAKSKNDLLLAAGTSKGIKIGSSLEEVLKAHEWPAYFIPFTTEPAAVVTLDPKNPLPKVSQAQGGKTGGGSASFATGESGSLKVNFANSCILLYPDDGLALTVMNFIVVRIQIGQELTKPSMQKFVPVGGATAGPAGQQPGMPR